MAKNLDKVLGSPITTIALIGAVIVAAVFISGGGALLSGGEDAVKSGGARAASATDVSAGPETTTPQIEPPSEAALSDAADAAEDSPSQLEEDATETAPAGEPAQTVVVAAADEADSTPAPRPERPAREPEPSQEARLVAAASEPAGANSFNRLMKKPSSAPNAPPARDGIHDPSNPGTGLLQWPSAAFDGMPKTSDGNKVDWVKALEQRKIAPRYEVDDPNAEPFLLDLVIIRQVKGSMPNVVYPHKQHTEWLDCSNCHDEIFTPQKGANQISMAGILLGQKCGVCHGKVAFPVSDCRRCHAQPKTAEELNALADRSSWATDSK